MKLWYAAASPFVRKVLILAHEAGIADRLELFDAATTPLDPNEDLARDNPLGKIPALVLEDGHSIFDSPVICDYLDSIHDGKKLIPASGMERTNALVTEALGDGIMEAAVGIRYELALRPKEKQWDEWTDGQFRKITQALDTLEMWRGAKLPEIHIGSIAVVSALGYLDFRFPDFDWRTDRPVLTQMFATFSKRKSMIESNPEKPV